MARRTRNARATRTHETRWDQPTHNSNQWRRSPVFRQYTPSSRVQQSGPPTSTPRGPLSSPHAVARLTQRPSRCTLTSRASAELRQRRDISPDPRGNFQSGDAVTATHDLIVRDNVVVCQGDRGCVVGPALSAGRVCVHFDRRLDASNTRLNCMPDQLRHIVGRQPWAHMRATWLSEVPHNRDIAPGALEADTLRRDANPLPSSNSPPSRTPFRFRDTPGAADDVGASLVE